jgi:hypothetical protein
MKVVAAVLVTLLLGAGASEAAWWPKKRLPKPIDYPVVRAKVKEGHKAGNKSKHPPGIAQVQAPADTARA